MSMHRNLKLGLLVTALGFAAAMPATAASFSFGVMADTQWKSNTSSTGGNNTVATGIIDSLNQQFIGAKVDFVVQVGDLVDSEGTGAVNMETRANHAQALYDAGIGFMPLRGNHEASTTAATKFQTLFPQTQNAGTNALSGASNFSSPTGMTGLSYAFDYKGATFVMLDQFKTPALTSQSVLSQSQVDWVGGVLSNKADNANAFVFAHKGLITPNHTDTLFGSNPSVAPDLQNQFMSHLANNDARYLWGGHDHIDNRSIVTSPDGTSTVQGITTSSNSYKFYVPKTGASINDIKYNSPTYGMTGPRETVVSQQMYSIGYYLVNVDGPKVTVDFYSSPNGCDGDCDLTALPALNYSKQETFGYSLNGKQFLVAAGDSFVGITDSIATGNGFVGTSMQFLDGVNGNNVNIYDGRATVSDVNTGWTSKEELDDAKLRSDMLTLWGVSDLSNSEANSVKLSMSYTGDDAVYLLKRVNGQWVNAGSDMGYDALTHTAWATVSQSALEAGEFVVAVPEPETYAMMLAGLGLVGFMARRRNGRVG